MNLFMCVKVSTCSFLLRYTKTVVSLGETGNPEVQSSGMGKKSEPRSELADLDAKMKNLQKVR